MQKGNVFAGTHQIYEAINEPYHRSIVLLLAHRVRVFPVRRLQIKPRHQRGAHGKVGNVVFNR